MLYIYGHNKITRRVREKKGIYYKADTDVEPIDEGGTGKV